MQKAKNKHRRAMDKRSFVFFCLMPTVLLLTVSLIGAQQTGRVYRIGYLTWGGSVEPFKPRLNALRHGLRELGYLEGKNIVIDERYGEGRRDRLPALAMELVRLKPDVIVTHGGSSAQAADRAAKKAGRTIPIVFAVTASPLRVVASLSRPGGNITGLSDSHSDLVPKRLELFKKVVPSASRVAVLLSPDSRLGARQFKALQAVAPRLGVTLLPVAFSKPDDLEGAFAVIQKERPDALNVLGYSLVAAYRRQIVEFALKNRLPSVHANQSWVLAGGLMSYGTNLLDLYRRSATYVDKILKGAKPADLPVEQPTRFYLTLNLKTAKVLGITFPPELLYRADKVIQ
jgi:putative ABC transport system substrate-binding protein